MMVKRMGKDLLGQSRTRLNGGARGERGEGRFFSRLEVDRAVTPLTVRVQRRPKSTTLTRSSLA